MGRELKYKPLVEAILEIRWKLREQGPGYETDPHYKLLLGRLYDRMQSEYPEHEQLPTANIPDELVGHVVQHRFRIAKGKWPLIQLGPGVFTVNSTADYTWSDFRSRALLAVQKLHDAHPNPEELKVTDVILRYIDAVDFNYLEEDALSFLREQLKLTVSLPTSLFAETQIDSCAQNFTCQATFKCNEPKGIVNVRFATGRKGRTPAIIWETTIHSAGNDVPDMPARFESWIDAAHGITDDWFFKLIEGELERRFQGE